MKKTLVIHIDDPSTDFLEEIYCHKEDWTVINDPYISQYEVIEQIRDHDRIIMLGHGSPSGLFGGYGMIIDADLAPLLRQKECVCIWCNADQFVEKHNLRGFYSGMFISEVQEAEMCGIYNTDEDDVDVSNYLFSMIVGDCIDDPASTMLDIVKGEYCGTDPVIRYNNERLYSR